MKKFHYLSSRSASCFTYPTIQRESSRKSTTFNVASINSVACSPPTLPTQCVLKTALCGGFQHTHKKPGTHPEPHLPTLARYNRLTHTLTHTQSSVCVKVRSKKLHLAKPDHCSHPPGHMWSRHGPADQSQLGSRTFHS